MLVSSILLSYASFNSSSMLQANICEEMGRQPELMRDMAESGLNLENCEYWFEGAVTAILGVLFFLAIVRVSLFTLAALWPRMFLCPFDGYLFSGSPSNRPLTHGFGLKTSA